jgi:hypothetical protein
VATTRRSCDIRIMAESPIDIDARSRLKVNVNRAAQKAMPARKRPRERLQFIRLRVERIVRTSKPGPSPRKAPHHGCFFGSRASMKLKTVYLNGAAVGSGRTWYEVAALLTELLRFHVSARDAQTRGSEGPDGFFVAFPG